MLTPRTVILAGAVVVVLAGCSDSTGLATPEMTGSWSMSLFSDGIVVPGEFTFTENAGQVSGTGSIQASGGPYDFTVSGQHAHPSVTLTVASEEFHDMSFTGGFTSADVVEGNITGSGFTGQRMTFARH